MTRILKFNHRDVIEVNSLFMKPAERSSKLQKFHVDLNSETPAEEQHTARIIVATSSAIATGLTLAEAVSVCFIEPDYHAHTMDQGYCRHCRQGNKNAVVHSWLLMCAGNQTEQRIQESNDMKRRIQQVQGRKAQVRSLGPGDGGDDDAGV